MLELTPQRLPLVRRQRRLRSWLRHERMTVAMTLAEKLHHTSRGQKLARVGEEVTRTTPHGDRRHHLRGILPEPVPQRSDRTMRRFAGAALPTLALPVLAGSAGEVVDSSSLRFLTASALKARREEEEEEEERKEEKEKEEKRLDVHAEPLTALERAHLWSEQASKRRKRKKRRKRRTPRTSSRPSHRRPRRWHAPGWFSSVFLLALCSSLSLAARDARHQGCFGPEEQLRAFS